MKDEIKPDRGATLAWALIVIAWTLGAICLALALTGCLDGDNVIPEPTTAEDPPEAPGGTLPPPVCSEIGCADAPVVDRRCATTGECYCDGDHDPATPAVRCVLQ